MIKSTIFRFEPRLEGYYYGQKRFEKFNIGTIEVLYYPWEDVYQCIASGKIGDKCVSYIENWTLDLRQDLGGRYKLQEMMTQAIKTESQVDQIWLQYRLDFLAAMQLKDRDEAFAKAESDYKERMKTIHDVGGDND
jgi:hypothetical protein